VSEKEKKGEHDQQNRKRDRFPGLKGVEGGDLKANMIVVQNFSVLEEEGKPSFFGIKKKKRKKGKHLKSCRGKKIELVTC